MPTPTPPPAPTQSVARFLAGVDALGWSEPERIRYVRTFLEDGIDALARAEDARLDFLAHCAQLASDNMQDARLHVTDERLAKLENPPSDATVAGFFVELALILALELTVMATATVAVPALIAFVAAGARARGVRKIIAEAGVELGVERVVGDQRRTSAALEAMSTALAYERNAYTEIRAAHASYEPEFTDARWAVRRAEREYAVALAAHEASETGVEQVQAAMAAVGGAVPPSLTSAELQEMLTGTLANTTVSRVAEQVATDEVVRELLATPPVGETPSSPLFQTSSLVGMFLQANEHARAAAAHEWSGLRSHIRVLPDAALVGSETAHRLLRELIEAPPEPDGPSAPRDADAIVRGMEGVLWLAWMRQTQALGIGAVAGVPVPSFGRARAGVVWRGIWVTSARHTDNTPIELKLDPLPGSADGVRYSGLLTLADGHAEYLYRQFAREYFLRNPDKSPVPLKFDAARYESLDALPDDERSDRVGEMKLLSIVYFRALQADPAAIGSSGDPLVERTRTTLRTLLDLPPEGNVFAVFLASQPPTSELTGDLPPAPPDPAQAAVAAFAAERLARDDAAKLATMVTDLDLLISLAPPVPVDESAGLVERFAAEDAKFAIEQQQQAVSDQYEAFLEHAAGQAALVDDVNTEYEARIAQLLDWPPPAPQLPSPTP